MKPDAPTRTSSRQAGTRAPIGRRMLKYGLAFITCALLLNALVGARGLPAVLQARREFQQVERDLERVRAENLALHQQIERLRNDADAVEEVARRDLGYIAPGEKVFIIRDVPPAAPVRPAPPSGKPASP